MLCCNKVATRCAVQPNTHSQAEQNRWAALFQDLTGLTASKKCLLSIISMNFAETCALNATLAMTTHNYWALTVRVVRWLCTWAPYLCAVCSICCMVNPPGRRVECSTLRDASNPREWWMCALSMQPPDSFRSAGKALHKSRSDAAEPHAMLVSTLRARITHARHAAANKSCKLSSSPPVPVLVVQG